MIKVSLTIKCFRQKWLLWIFFFYLQFCCVIPLYIRCANICTKCISNDDLYMTPRSRLRKIGSQRRKYYHIHLLVVHIVPVMNEIIYKRTLSFYYTIFTLVIIAFFSLPMFLIELLNRWRPLVEKWNIGIRWCRISILQREIIKRVDQIIDVWVTVININGVCFHIYK